MKKWLTQVLFDWVFVLLYSLFQGLLNLVKFIESFFDVFAGTAKIFYKGDANFLINIFFGHDAITNAFWAMALIAIVMAFGFCIVQVSRKAVDITGSVKQSVGQIVSSFLRCLLIILLINVITVTVINIANVLLDRINYALENAAVLNQQEDEKTFNEQEYALMTKILATVANYSVNPTADSRYNINSCFNAIRPDLLSLYVSGFFNYDYPMDLNGHYTWQGALALLASSADLTTDLSLDVYYSDVASAVQTVSREISTYRDFAPVERASFAVSEGINTDTLIFLIAGMESAQNSMYDTGDFNDALRKGYISGEKSYNDLKQVRKDFDIWTMNYIVGYIACVVFIIIMAICIFTFIVRMFNLLLLYLTAPLFASSMPMDDGAKWQSWTQAFVIQLFSGFGMVIAMRLYLIIIPVIISSDLVFFAGDGIFYAILNHFAQLLMVLGGAWAVLQSSSVITGILAGNPGMAAIQQEGQIGRMVTGWALAAPRAALGAAKLIGASTLGAAKMAGGAAAGAALSPSKLRQAYKALDNKIEGHHARRTQKMSDRLSRQQNMASALYDKANRQSIEGKLGKAQKTRAQAARAQQTASQTADKLAERRVKYGLDPYKNKYSDASGWVAPPRRPSPPPKEPGRAQRGAPGEIELTGTSSPSTTPSAFSDDGFPVGRLSALDLSARPERREAAVSEVRAASADSGVPGSRLPVREPSPSAVPTGTGVTRRRAVSDPLAPGAPGASAPPPPPPVQRGPITRKRAAKDPLADSPPPGKR